MKKHNDISSKLFDASCNVLPSAHDELNLGNGEAELTKEDLLELCQKLLAHNAGLQGKVEELVQANCHLEGLLEDALKESDQSVRLKLESILAPEGDIDNLELGDIIDARTLQALVDDFHELTGMPMSLVDLNGKVLVAVGWQQVCTDFHRINPDTCDNCIASDVELPAGNPLGEYRFYKCRNNMWGVATPVMLADKHLGNILMGQFFLEDEPLDYQLFRAQARAYRFDEREYIAALEAVPRLSRKELNTAITFLMKLAGVLSRLGYSNLKLARSLSERDAFMLSQRQSEQRLQLFIEHAPAALAMFDTEMRYLSVSRRWLSDYHLGERDLTGESHYDIFPEITAKWREAHRRGLAGEVLRAEADRFERDDGSVQWVRWEIRPWYDAQGKIGGIVIFAEDITASRRAEEALRESMRREQERAAELATLLDAVPTPVLIAHDSECLSITGNRAADELLFIPRGAEASLSAPDEVRPRHFRALKDGRELGLDELPAQRAARGTPVEDFEFSIAFDDGTIRHVLGYGTPLRDEEGGPRGAVHVLVDITERKRAEEVLQQKQADLLEAQSIAKIGSWRWDAHTDATTGTDELLRIYGFDPALQEMPDFRHQRGVCYPVADWERINAAVQDTLRAGVGYELDVQAFRDGAPIWVKTRSAAVLDAQGCVVGLRGTVQDITEHRRAEQSLRESEARYRTLVETAPFAIFINRNNRIEYANPAAIRLFGANGSADLIGRSPYDFVHPEFHATMTERIRILLQGGSVPLAETRILQANGGERFVEVNALVLVDAQGSAIQVMMHDITERKHAEAALRASERRYSALFDNKINGMAHCRVITDDNNRPVDYWILQVNDAYERIIGINKAEIEGRRVTEVFPDIESYAFDYIGSYGKIALEGGEIKFEERFEATQQYLSIYAYSPLPGEFIAIFTDVTQRKWAEEELKRVNDELESRVKERTENLLATLDALLTEIAERKHTEEQLQHALAAARTANSAMSRSVRTIAHEFRTPLGLLIGGTDILDRYWDRLTPEKRLEQNGKIRNAAQQIANLVNSVTSFNELGADESRTTPVLQDLGEICRSIAAEVEQVWSDGHEFVVSIARNCGAALIDDIQFRRILQNLLTNAFRYTPSQGAVSLRGHRKKNRLFLEITDNGIGIPEQDQALIFDPFYRSGNVEGRRGVGLGLAIVKEALSQVKGTITVTSKLGVGTTMRVEIPVAEPV